MSPYQAMANNPISFNDPDGDFIPAMLVGAAIGLATNGISNLVQGNNFFKGGLQAAFFGAWGGGVSFGIGHAFGAVSGIGNELLRAGAHGLSGGLQSLGQGGSFGSGFVSGALGSGIGSGIEALGGNATAQIIGGGLSGGIGSSLSGGSFWQGAGIGLSAGILNHGIQHGLESIRKQIALNAESQIGSKDWNYDVEKDNFGKNTNKCNKFCYDMLLEAGADPGTPNGNRLGKMFGQDGTSPPTAGQWADPNYKIPGWRVVSSPRRGDIVAYRHNYSDATGHVAIVSTNARAFRFSIGTSGTYNAIAKTNFGFSLSPRYIPKGSSYVYRRYVGN